MTSPTTAPFQKILNFRDVAALVNPPRGNTILRPGLLFRSGLPDDATPVDRSRLADEYQVKTILDLRTDTERLEHPPDPAGDLHIPGVQYTHINLNGNAFSGALIRQLSYWNIAKLVGLYALGYRNEAIAVLGRNVMAKRGLKGLAEDSLTHSTAEIKAIFDILSDPINYPLLVHCTQGKDRTGLVMLLVLLLLGAPLENVSRDYMLSEQELVAERETRLVQIRGIGLPDDFAGCAPGWVESVASWLEEKYRQGPSPGIRQYLLSCRVSREQQDRVCAILTGSETVST